jgi:GNAT superfamily N-acetyltransferase
MRDIPHDALLGRGLIAPVAPGDDERLWRDCDLASLAEHRLDDPTDPRELTPARRAEWIARATSDGDASLAARSHEGCYWLLEDGARVGTVALSRHAFGFADAGLSSFYVFPTLRGRGVGRRALERLGHALAAAGCGYRLDTAWAWRRTVRFYLRAGLWVRHWKHDLTLFWARDLPRPIIDVGPHRATLAVKHEGERVVLAEARYEGERLWLDAARAPADDRTLGPAYWHAASTLALALAMEGKALIRSPERWEEARHADADAPEALAYKITIWEAFDRAHGWRVAQPRIPGLVYPTWAEFEARWAAANAAFKAEMEANGGVIRARK